MLLSRRSLIVGGVLAGLAACSGSPSPPTPYTKATSSYGPLSRQVLDVYTPRSGVTSQTPILVFFHGGGWYEGNKDQYAYVGDSFARAGLITVVPNYRLYPEVRFPAFVEDGAAVVAWLRTTYPGRRIFLAGHSAGGMIAALLALDEHYLPSPIAGAVVLAGPHDTFHLTNPDLAKIFAGSGEASRSVNFADGTEPPMLLLSGAEDPLLVSDQATLRQAIEARGGRVESKVYPGIDHLEIVDALRPRSREPVRADILAWLAST